MLAIPRRRRRRECGNRLPAAQLAQDKFRNRPDNPSEDGACLPRPRLAFRSTRPFYCFGGFCDCVGFWRAFCLQLRLSPPTTPFWSRQSCRVSRRSPRRSIPEVGPRLQVASRQPPLPRRRLRIMTSHADVTAWSNKSFGSSGISSLLRDFSVGRGKGEKRRVSNADRCCYCAASVTFVFQVTSSRSPTLI